MKKLSYIFLLVFFLGTSKQELKANSFIEIRSFKQLAFIVASLGIAAGGTYLMSKSSRGIINKLASTLGGICMITSGLAGIVFSDAIINSIEVAIERAMQDNN